MNQISAINSSHDEFIVQLTAGLMKLTVRPGSYRPEDLFAMAERINPKRAFLFVSKVLGRHIPVQASIHRDILHALAARLIPQLPQQPVLVAGYAETAVGLGAGIFDEIHKAGFDAAYLPTTRHPGSHNCEFAFSEDHSHATGHHVLTPTNPAIARILDVARTLVLVDDEVTSGKTFENYLRAATDAGWRFDRIILATLTDWSDGEVAAKIASVLDYGPEVSIVSLMQGQWNWQAFEQGHQANLPSAVAPVKHPVALPNANDWRFGLKDSQADLTLQAVEGIQPGSDVLVIGTGEYVWQAFQFAEAMERQGFNAAFLATTRSPVLTGGPIRHKAAFRDHYGLGVQMYLHNVEPGAWSHIFVLIEDETADCLDPDLIQYLGKFSAVTPSGKTINFEKI